MAKQHHEIRVVNTFILLLWDFFANAQGSSFHGQNIFGIANVSLKKERRSAKDALV